MVQLGSFGEEQNARQLAERAETLGFTASVSTFTTNGRPIFRVRIGPTSSREGAAAIAELLTSNGFAQPWVLNESEQRANQLLKETTVLVTADERPAADLRAIEASLAAHRVLLEQSVNFWETRWLEREIETLERRLEDGS